MTRDAEELLTQWGKWVWQETGVPRCGSPMLAIMRDNVAMERCLSASISDDDAMLIDGIIARMGRRDEEMANCVRVYYATEMKKPSARLGSELLEWPAMISGLPAPGML